MRKVTSASTAEGSSPTASSAIQKRTGWMSSTTISSATRRVRPPRPRRTSKVCTKGRSAKRARSAQPIAPTTARKPASRGTHHHFTEADDTVAATSTTVMAASTIRMTTSAVIIWPTVGTCLGSSFLRIAIRTQAPT